MSGKFSDLVAEVMILAARMSLAKGLDHRYPARQVTGGDGVKGAGYYLAAAGAGEPDGTWRGAGLAHLGLESGQVVEQGPHDLLFQQRRAPDGSKLGRAPGNGGAKAAEVYGRLIAAEPEATDSRRRELRMQAQREVRQSPLYYDATFSISKSVSAWHASLGENARRAMARGHTREALRWAGLVAEVDKMIEQANDAALAYMQREAGYVRTGSHRGSVNGERTGKWAPADLVVASWYQHTSRDGDPQLHVHNQILHAARDQATGKWLAPDNNGYFDQARAAGVVGSVHLENALTRRFGLHWVERADGQGHEIRGVSQAVMDAFSSRRKDVERRMVSEVIPQFIAAYDREPTQAELASLRQDATLATRSGKPDGTIDWDATHAGWTSKLAQALGVDLASVARVVFRNHASRARNAEPSDFETRRAAEKALERCSAEKATWTRADLVAHIGRVLPRTGMDPAAAAALTERLADWTLLGEAGPVVSMESPEVVRLPPELVRGDGQSAYSRHGATRYATRAQLAAEEQLVDLARRPAGARMDPAAAADLLGASPEELTAALQGTAADPSQVLERSGLRLDQAAAAWAQLTSPDLITVINAPAGSGKTTTAGAMARAWSGQGQVIGVTPSSISRETLSEQISESYNFAQFLGDLEGKPGARGHVPVQPGALIIADEGSMFGTDTLLRVARVAAQSGAKLVLIGDTGQLTSVENGGGMSLIAGRRGYAQIWEPMRFRAQWEREASLRLRAGDVSVLPEYADRGRIRGGHLEEILDDAAGAYVARTLEGRDVLLSVRDNATRRELCRRIQGELRHLGKADRKRTVPIGAQQRAGAGDLLVCTANDTKQDTGDGKSLSNRHLLRVEEITGDGKLVLRRVVSSDPATGDRQFLGKTFTYGARSRFELGYAVTQHCAQSRTVYSGMEVVTGSEDMQGTLVGATRGTTENLIYVATPSPRLADPDPAERPAPEIARAARLESDRQGRTALQGDARVSAGKADAVLHEALAVLADVLERDGAAKSATEYQRAILADADHLGKLGAMWEDQTWQARDGRYARMVAAVLPEGYKADSPAARWLHRTLRSAELAGQDPQLILRQAVDGSSLEGLRDVAAGVDARIRKTAGSFVPQPRPKWSDQVPDVSNPGMQQFVRDVAAAMDGRQERIGEHAGAAEHGWAVAALGPVPEEPGARVEWQQRAGAIGAYREWFCYDDERDPIGPEPAAGESPDKRAMWHDALRALGPAEGTDLRGRSDGSLLLMRDTYAAETAWAPRYVAPVLGMVRQHAEDAAMGATRSDAEAARAREAGDSKLAGRHAARADASRSREGLYRTQERLLEAAATERQEWQQATEAQRRLAVAADTEYRRRHPDEKLEPLKSAEPGPVTDEERDAAARGPVPSWVEQLAEASGKHQERMEERRNVLVPDEDPDYSPEGEAFPAWRQVRGGPVLHLPKPDMPPAPSARDREAEADREAG